MNRKPTPRQKKAAKAIVLNMISDNPKPTGQVLESVGYGKITQDPKRIIESEGFKQAVSSTGLRKALENAGINSQKIADKINVLLDANNGDNPDYNAIDKGLKHATAIYGIDPDKPKEGNTYNFILNPIFKEQIKPLEEALKQQFRNAQSTQTTQEPMDNIEEE